MKPLINAYYINCFLLKIEGKYTLKIWSCILQNGRIVNETDKELISKIYKQLMQLNTRKTNNPVKSGQETWTDISPKTYRWLPNTWRDAQHHSLENCKSKPQWGIISHMSEWPSSKSLQTINAGDGVEKREPSSTVGGNVKWYSHRGEENRVEIP